MLDVRIARVSSDVCTTVGRTSAFFSSSPPSLACSSPSSVRSTSTHPVNRFFLFQSLSPWRSRISVAGMRQILSYGGAPLLLGCGEPRERLEVGRRLPALLPPGPLAPDRAGEAELQQRVERLVGVLQ